MISNTCTLDMPCLKAPVFSNLVYGAKMNSQVGHAFVKQDPTQNSTRKYPKTHLIQYYAWKSDGTGSWGGTNTMNTIPTILMHRVLLLHEHV